VHDINVNGIRSHNPDFDLVRTALLDRHNKLTKYLPDGAIQVRRQLTVNEQYAAMYIETICALAGTATMAFGRRWDAAGYALARPTFEAMVRMTNIYDLTEDDHDARMAVAEHERLNLAEEWRKLLGRYAIKELEEEKNLRSVLQFLNAAAHGKIDLIYGAWAGPEERSEGLPGGYHGSWFWVAMQIYGFAVLHASVVWWKTKGHEKRAGEAANAIGTEDWTELFYTRNGLKTRIYVGEASGLLKNERGETHEDPAEIRAARKRHNRQRGRR
jgi:hypothetical protein